MSEWRIIITGCGTSHGSPPWGWPELWSEDPRDHRRRSGAMLLGPAGEVVLLDAGPDLMHQLRNHYADWDGRTYPARCVTRCDGVLLTHDHADHTHGINELRHLNRLQGGRPITVYAHPSHLEVVRQMFPYCFDCDPDSAYYLCKPALRMAPLSDGEPVVIGGLRVMPFELSHGAAGRTTGFRCGGLAYCTDVKAIPEASFAYLQGLDLLVLGMLRVDAHETHMHLEEALAVIARLAPRRTIFVHMGPEMRYADWQGRLPDGVELGFDGLAATFTVDAS